MAKRILVPVMPSERFYDAVVAAGDIVAQEGGIITFLFTTVRPQPLDEEKQESQTESQMEVAPERGDVEDLEQWRETMVEGLEDARQLLYEREVDDSHIDYAFADYEQTTAAAIAEEASAGAYDLVVISKGYFVELPDVAGEDSADIAAAVEELADDGVRLLVT